MKKATVYRPKFLIDGKQIEQQPGSQWIAVPDKFAGRAFSVEYGGVTMSIKSWNDAKLFKRFRDKYYTVDNGRKQYYTLGYFPFTPDQTNDEQGGETAEPTAMSLF